MTGTALRLVRNSDQSKAAGRLVREATDIADEHLQLVSSLAAGFRERANVAAALSRMGVLLRQALSAVGPKHESTEVLRSLVYSCELLEFLCKWESSYKSRCVELSEHINRALTLAVNLLPERHAA